MLGSLDTFTTRWRQYRADLIAKAEAQTGWVPVDAFIMMPWFPVLFAGCVLCAALDVAFHLGVIGRTIVLAPFALVGIGGMIYAGGTYAYYGLRADLRRREEAKAKGP
ncbi:hypothetical protein [Phenylobacterium koreense]|uniref:DUF2628 domain-containing protein n=1 Tax=Phenylobacterium koreense TaxID=266125 RepID=A0ABV2EGM3_9CAUL